MSSVVTNQSINASGMKNATLNNLAEQISSVLYKSDGRLEFNYHNQMLNSYYYPNINGYYLIFMIPPPFELLPSGHPTKELMDVFQLVTGFQAIDFSPPVQQVQSSVVRSRSGGFPYATEVISSEQCSITYIDDYQLLIYKTHLAWVSFIKEVIEGFIKIPEDHQYLKYEDNNKYYGALDYAGSIYVAKYDPSFTNLLHVGKMTGVYPQSLSSKEMVGTRTSNELTTISISYNCGFYEEAVEDSHPLIKELLEYIKCLYVRAS